MQMTSRTVVVEDDVVNSVVVDVVDVLRVGQGHGTAAGSSDLESGGGKSVTEAPNF